SEWLTCGAGSRVSACGKYADLCRQRTARAAARTTTTIASTTVNAGQPKAVMAFFDPLGDFDFSTIFSETDPQSSGSTLLNYNTSHNPENEVKRTKLKAPAVASASEAAGQFPPAVTTVVRTEENTPGESPRGQDGVSESAHESNAISHASDGAAASDINLPGVGTNSGHSPAAAVSPAPVPAERTEAASAGDNQAGSSGRSTTNADSKANQTTPAASTTENNNSVNRDSNSVNTLNNKESNATTTTTTTTLPPATAVSEGNVDASAATTTNINSEAPTTTPSPSPVPNAEINITSAMQKNRPIVDSSVSPVWMHTAAPLLIVAVLVSATVY
ncbi:uncharacterized protein TM35_001381000, partial [Trypanosoma theileri]